jgi:type III secretion system (T3SS) inner membrane Yop/YscD-like protein
MRNDCPNCGAALGGEPLAAGKATRICGACGHVIVVGATPDRATEDEPHTAPLLETPGEGDLPTSIGVAGQLLRLPAGKRVAVALLSGEGKGKAVVLTEPRLSIGRTGGGADLEVPDPDVSRTHAVVECHGPRIVLRDLGSRNGTFVGADRISQREVEDRTEFRIGATTLVVLVTDA